MIFKEFTLNLRIFIVVAVLSGCVQTGFTHPSDMPIQQLAEAVVVDFAPLPATEGVTLGKNPIKSAVATLLFPANRPIQGKVVFEFSRLKDFYRGGSFNNWRPAVDENQVIIRNITNNNDQPIILPEVPYLDVRGANVAFMNIDFSNIKIASGDYVIVIRTKGDIFRSKPIRVDGGAIFYSGLQNIANTKDGGSKATPTITIPKSLNEKGAP